jgi:hypothetical protein
MTSALKKGGSPRGYLAHVRALLSCDYLVCTPVRGTYQHLRPLDFGPGRWVCVSANFFVPDSIGHSDRTGRGTPPCISDDGP